MTTTLSSASFYVGPDEYPYKYRLLRMVGSGGEAQLWKAELTVADAAEPVAVKMLRPEHNTDFRRLSQRWAEQAELLRFVRKLGVVGVREPFEGAPPHTVDSSPTTARQLYLVMNWVEGQSLRDWKMLNDGPNAALRALEHLEQIAEVLDWLHSGQATPGGRPLVHGDLSPGNIMIDEAGQAILVDFGLIQTSRHITRGPMGTPGYAAPEVWSEGHYSPASDRYSFGAVAYFTLLGAAPHGGPDESRAALLTSPLFGSRAPANVDRLMTIFAARPDDRPDTALDWVRLLRNTAATTRQSHVTSPPAPPTPPRSARPWIAAASMACLIAVAAIGYIFFGLSHNAGGDTSAASATPAATIPADPTTVAAPSSSLAISSTTPPAATPTNSSIAEPTVRRKSSTPLILNAYYDADLDTLHPNWNVEKNGVPSNDFLHYRDAITPSVQSQVAKATGTPSYATCSAATNFDTEFKVKNLSVGDIFCIVTDEKRLAMAVVRQLPDQDHPFGPVSFDVTVWNTTQQ